MSAYAPPIGRERMVAALASGLILAGLVVMLVIGLRPSSGRAPVRGILTAFTPRPAQPAKLRPPPPPRSPPRRAAAAPRRAPAPTAPHDLAAPVVAPPPPVVLLPRPVITASLAADGAGAQSGSAWSGHGTGAGGVGDGTGGGGSGGDGSISGIATHVRQLRGQLSPRDVPDGLIGPGGQVSVSVRFTITPQGRASGCRVTRSSGSPAIDALPCPLLEQRYRFRPARDRGGQPVAEPLEETHTWFEPAR